MTSIHETLTLTTLAGLAVLIIGILASVVLYYLSPDDTDDLCDACDLRGAYDAEDDRIDAELRRLGMTWHARHAARAATAVGGEWDIEPDLGGSDQIVDPAIDAITDLAMADIRDTRPVNPQSRLAAMLRCQPATLVRPCPQCGRMSPRSLAVNQPACDGCVMAVVGKGKGRVET